MEYGLRSRTAGSTGRLDRLWLGVSVIVRGSSLLELLNKGILFPLGKGGGDAVVEALQLRHLRWVVSDGFDVDRSSIRPQHKRHSRVIHDDDPGVILLGDDDKDTVLEIFVGDRLIIKQREVGARGF